VSSNDRAARYGQKAVSIALTGTHGEQVAYQLERKLFDNGHAATVLTANITALNKSDLWKTCLCQNQDHKVY
jgi:bifunctional enzyme CysN/CysC